MAAELGTSGADVLTPLALLLGLGSWLEPLLDRGPVRDITAQIGRASCRERVF